jgi:thiamine kinase-like enzyme
MTTKIFDPNLLPALKKKFPSIVSYSVLGTIKQANAVGFKVQLIYENVAEDKRQHEAPEMVFVKVVHAMDYLASKKDWPDLRRTLLYARTECRFYDQMLPVMASKGFQSFPKAYLAEYRLNDWIAEDEIASAPPETLIDIDQLPDPEEKGGVLILEYVSEDLYFQSSPLSMDDCKKCLGAVAAMHAGAWQDVELLKQAERSLSKASFHLSTRNPKEIAGISDAWESFRKAFALHLDLSNLSTESIQNLGNRIHRHAEYISNQISPKPDDQYATIIHGDYKSMNVFLPKSEGGTAILVDFASVGLGMGMSDVAMHVHHAVAPENLADGGEEVLVKHYWELLQSSLESDYPFETAMRHYRFAVVDYFRFFLGRFWKTATPESMKNKIDSKNTSLINRSIPAAIAFVERVERYLTVIEQDINVSDITSVT